MQAGSRGMELEEAEVEGRCTFPGRSSPTPIFIVTAVGFQPTVSSSFHLDANTLHFAVAHLPEAEFRNPSLC